ncbi:MAG: hypothetical protein ACLFPE_09590 [Bacteroidales bacterium]
MEKAETRSRFLALLVFGIAMGFLEAAIVVYLRKLYFPAGFSFPLVVPDDPLVIFAELVREVAAVVMLLALAWIAGKNFLQRFAWFLISFAFWDIFYYVGLKIFLNWPESLLTWDVLYLIPVTWVGPVLAPVLSSLLMIALGWALLRVDRAGQEVKTNEWMMIYSGAFIIFLTFIWDFSVMIVRHDLYYAFFSIPENERYISLVETYVPDKYNWFMFAVAVLLIGWAVSRMLRRTGPLFRGAV